MDNLPCTRCKGEGSRTSPAFMSVEGTEYPARTRPCLCCDGTGSFPPVDVKAIVEVLTTTRGASKGKRRFKTATPCNPWREKNHTLRRAYYVWRLARFHGGADVSLPNTAITFTEGDPCVKQLDALADIVAKLQYGTKMAAATRWGGLLGFTKNPPQEGLPGSAYEGGPVTDEYKPAFETLEAH